MKTVAYILAAVVLYLTGKNMLMCPTCDLLWGLLGIFLMSLAFAIVIITGLRLLGRGRR